MGAVRPVVRAGFVMFVFGAVLALPGSAEAGGSPFGPGRDHYAVGDRVSIEGGICETGQLNGTLKDGPYFLSLVPGASERSGMPSPSAIQVAEIQIAGTGGCDLRAHAEFVVPDVPPGYWSLAYCNDPCTVNGLGDVVTWGFWIGSTRLESALLSRVDRLERTVGTLSERARDLRESKRALEVTTARLADARTELVAVQERADLVSTQLADARRRTVDMRNRLDGAVFAPSRFALATALAVVALLVVILVTLLRRRQEPADPQAESANSGMA
ncbi:MAG: hypothetical protein WEA10_04810 [Actinomycetota bacterium]